MYVVLKRPDVLLEFSMSSEPLSPSDEIVYPYGPMVHLGDRPARLQSSSPASLSIQRSPERSATRGFERRLQKDKVFPVTL